MKNCGCEIKPKDAYRLIINETDMTIIYCRLHAHAGEMLEALKDARLILRCIVFSKFSPASVDAALESVRNAINRTEGED